MRGAVDGLESPHPIGLLLPAAMQEDDFAQRFCAGLDGVLAPLFALLDSQDAYFHPDLAPEDFLAWLGGWIGVAFDEDWDETRKRELVRRGAALYAQRGTVRGLRELIEITMGVEAEVTDSGGAGWSPVPDGELPGYEEAALVVRVTGDVDQRRLHDLVEASTPAHVPFLVEVEPA